MKETTNKSAGFIETGYNTGHSAAFFQLFDYSYLIFGQPPAFHFDFHEGDPAIGSDQNEIRNTRNNAGDFIFIPFEFGAAPFIWNMKQEQARVLELAELPDCQTKMILRAEEFRIGVYSH